MCVYVSFEILSYVLRMFSSDNFVGSLTFPFYSDHFLGCRLPIVS